LKIGGSFWHFLSTFYDQLFINHEERVKSPEGLFQKASRLFDFDLVQICAVGAVGLPNAQP
jgi:hypothetical protein